MDINRPTKAAKHIGIVLKKLKKFTRANMEMGEEGM